MRSIFHPELAQISLGSVITIDGDRAKHLIKSVRLTEGEAILLLDGKGAKGLCSVEKINRHDVSLKIVSVEQVPRDASIDLAICCSKKEAMEEIVRNSVELGIHTVIPVFSQYAQRDYNWNSRLERIAESALIQSNNPYFPHFAPAISWGELLKEIENYRQVFYFSSQTSGHAIEKKSDRCLMIIGPEGGLSSLEEEQLTQISHLQLLQLKTPIMRAPTAQIAAVGWLKALGF